MAEQYDLLIRGGTLVDGTGSPGAQADVGVRGDRIAKVGALGDAEGGRVIDASGLTVAPGFIDVHSHDDCACLTTPLDFKLMQGVTTDVLGNCGAGVAPRDPQRSSVPMVGMVLGEVPEMNWQSFAEYMDVVARADLGINVACMVPHGAVRHAVMGMDRRAPSDDELTEMRAHIDNGMAAGAVGFSTGLIYPPGTFAETDEIVECAKIAAAHGSVYVSHIRNEAERLMEAVEEAIEIGERAGLPVQVSHHKASAREVWGKTIESIALIEQARARGTDVTFDAYPYMAGSTVLAAARQIGRAIDPAEIMIASCQQRHEYEGKTLAQIGEMLELSDGTEILNRVLSEEPGAVAIFFSMHEDDVRRVLSHELCMIGSDGIPTPDGKPHPRLYGTFPRVLQYARDEGLFSIEEAVRKMTSLPADRFRLEGRGRLIGGAFADVVVFNAETVADVATYQEPRQYPAGIEYVVVNGHVAAEGGAQTERSGRAVVAPGSRLEGHQALDQALGECDNHQAMNDNTKRVSEALREYVTDPPVTTMSSKRQITLPAEIVRRLGLKPGAKLAVYVDDGSIVLRHRPGTWVEYVTSGPHTFKTKADVDAYLREVREGWDERARKFEGDSYIAPDED